MNIWLLKPFTSPRHCLMFTGVTMVVVGVAQLFYPQLPHELAGDGVSYIEFWVRRTALYPALLDLFGDDTLYNYQHNLDRIAITQTTIYIVAVGFMMWGLAIARLPISALVLFLLAFAVNYQLHFYHRVLLTESLGLSLVCCLIATLALWFRTHHYRWLVVAMLVATIAFGLRPNMIAMPIGVSIIVLFHMVHTRQWKKPLLAIVVPFILVMGFEHAYFHAHNETRSPELLHRHMFGKAVMVLAINEADGQDDRFYQAEFATLKPFMHRFGELFRADRDRYWASGDVCVWLTTHEIYEEGAYSQIELGRMSPPNPDWAWQIFATYPTTLARLTAQHYINFFCVGSITLAKAAIASNEMIRLQPPTYSTPRQRLLLQLIAWAFIALGIAFFASKLWYGYRWLRRIIRWLSSRVPLPRWLSHAPPLTSHEALGSTLIMLAFGYNLFIAIFSVSITRFLIISYPLIVLGILLMAVVILKETCNAKTS